MQNVTMINKLNDLKSFCIEDENLINKIDTLIEELKIEETSKGFSTNEKERLKLALSIQKKMMKKGRPIFALWNYNQNDNKYYWTNSAIMVRLSKDNFFNELKTTNDDIKMFDKHGLPYFVWYKQQKNDYPNCSKVWLDTNKEAKKIKINIKDFMLFLKVNKDCEFLNIKIDEETTIAFNRELIYNALILSKVAQQETATMRY